jgi:hypothetical protein
MLDSDVGCSLTPETPSVATQLTAAERDGLLLIFADKQAAMTSSIAEPLRAFGFALARPR